MKINNIIDILKVNLTECHDDMQAVVYDFKPSVKEFKESKRNLKKARKAVRELHDILLKELDDIDKLLHQAAKSMEMAGSLHISKAEKEKYEALRQQQKEAYHNLHIVTEVINGEGKIKWKPQ